MIPAPAFITSGPHLSGYRVCLGYNTLTEAQDAHAALAASKTPETPVGEGDAAQRVRDILYRDMDGETPIGKTADDILQALATLSSTSEGGGK